MTFPIEKKPDEQPEHNLAGILCFSHWLTYSSDIKILQIKRTGILGGTYYARVLQTFLSKM